MRSRAAATRSPVRGLWPCGIRWPFARAAQWPTRPAASVGDDVVEVQRLVDGGKPLGPGGGAPSAALVERQAQGFEQRLHLLAGGEVRQIGPRPERRLVEVVEGGQPARK